MKRPIYMDYHATTPVDPRVLESMLPYFTSHYGNPASKQHIFGLEAEAAVEKARSQVAQLIGAKSEEIFFTSGATEANNLALIGLMESHFGKESNLITTSIEHSSIQAVCDYLLKKGVKIKVLGVDSRGRLDLEELKRNMNESTQLVTVMMANNEIGTLQSLMEIGKICKERGVLFHTDAAQACGKIPIDVEKMHIDLLSISGHKNYAPKGVGSLYVRSKNPQVHLTSQIHGGGHEKGLRSGTLNVPGIVALGKACEISHHDMPQEMERLKRLRDHLQKKLSENIEDLRINGDLEHRLPLNLNVTFPQVRSEILMMNLKKEVVFSSGSACASAHPQPSHVLKAIGLSDEMTKCSVRFAIGRFTTLEEVEFVAQRVVEEVKKIRG